MRALEDLRVQVLSTQSRRYIDEAIAAYGAGAYRSAIIAIWIAITADVMYKLRLLADQGDRAAQAAQRDLDRAISSGDKTSLQKFENGLLAQARDTFQFIGDREHTELSRIYEDRNLCAHPAYSRGNDELFSPTPELVRAHLSTAIDALLSHGPVTGRKAIERFEREIRESSFPQDDAKLKEYLSESYMHRGTPALRVNLMKVICKSTLDADHDDYLRWKYTRSARVLQDLRPIEFEESLKAVLDARQDNLDDEGLFLLVNGLCQLQETWPLLHAGVQHRIEELLGQLPIHDLVIRSQLYSPLPPEPIRSFLITRLGEAVMSTSDSRYFNQFGSPDPDLVPHLAGLVVDAQSYSEAAAPLGWVNSMSEEIPLDGLRTVLAAYSRSGQARTSILASRQLKALRAATEHRPGFADAWKDFEEKMAAGEDFGEPPVVPSAPTAAP
ncbi:hypothetical protein ONA70_30340 [Micromonospora yasonensis]|uniref:hypothetical protein n=1 Tax=Micromonospora yasonensis TaxID=1128667 RepID=UPI00222EEB5B|nr:hypothetical protein [Micromonospora yasonensis]MCW3844395.1 hypothetical protein [Micromonospora yasonensis]